MSMHYRDHQKPARQDAPVGEDKPHHRKYHVGTEDPGRGLEISTGEGLGRDDVERRAPPNANWTHPMMDSLSIC